MLTPRAYRAALLDELVTSPAEPLPADTDADTPQGAIGPLHAPDRDARPALRLARTSAPPQHVSRERDARRRSTPASSAGSRNLMEDFVEPSSHAGWTLAEQHSREALQRRVAYTMATSAHPRAAAAPGVEAEQNRSIILSFIDACNASGVPEAVIAEQVQFIVSSMKESLALHAALHARQHRDRIREYEVQELAAALERQQLLCQQHGPQAASLATPGGEAGAALEASHAQRLLAPPPPLTYGDAAAPSFAPAADLEFRGEAARRDARDYGTSPLSYAPLTQRPSSNAAVEGVGKAVVPAKAPPAARFGSALFGGPADHGTVTSAPVSAWHSRAPAQPDPPTTESARTGMQARTSKSGAPPPHQATQSSARTARQRRPSSCRHSSHHKLCNVCYAASAQEAASAAAPTPRVSFTDAVVTSDEAAGSRDGRTPPPPRRTRYTPRQNYMRPTHASLARREPASRSTSPRRENSVPSPYSDWGASAGGSPWQGSHNGTNASVTTADGHQIDNAAAPRRLVVRSTLSSRLRAAQTAQAAEPHVEPSRASSRGPTLQRSHSEHAAERSRQLRSPGPLARHSVPRLDQWSNVAAESDVHDYQHPPHGSMAANSSSGYAFAAPATSSSATDSYSDACGSHAVVEVAGSVGGVAERAVTVSSARPDSAAPGPSVMPVSRSVTLNGSATEERTPAVAARRPRRPPPSAEATPTPPPVAVVVDMDRDAANDVPVCVTSPELQIFLERSQWKLRETERMLARQPQSSLIPQSYPKAVSHLPRSPSPTAAAQPHPQQAAAAAAAAAATQVVSSRGLVGSSATTLPTPTQPSILDGDTTSTTAAAATGWSADSLDAVRARQGQRLAELHRRLSAYEATSSVRSSNGEEGEGAMSSRQPSHSATAGGALAGGATSRSFSPTASSVFRPHDVVAAAGTAAAAHPASADNSPLVRLSPTSSDEANDVTEGEDTMA